MTINNIGNIVPGPILESLIPGINGDIINDALGNNDVQTGIVNSCLNWIRTHIVTPIKGSKIIQSRAFQIASVALGIILLVAGLCLTFVLQSELGGNAFYFLIPAAVGLLKLLSTSICLEKAHCTPEKWLLCKRLLATTEDILDNGKLDNSNTIFTDDIVNGRG